MINDFRPRLEAYSFPESRNDSFKYLSQYWLSKEEYCYKWEKLLSSIFNVRNSNGESFIKSPFVRMTQVGGLLFVEEEFEHFKKCMNICNDMFLFIIEDYDENNPPHDSGPSMRFKYPSDITWEQINQQEGISYELFQRPVRNYFVFGDSGNWGKYVANDYDSPVDIICYKPQFQFLFQQLFNPECI